MQSASHLVPRLLNGSSTVVPAQINAAFVSSAFCFVGRWREKGSDEGGGVGGVGVGVGGDEGDVLRAQFTLAINHSPQKSYGGVRRGV